MPDLLIELFSEEIPARMQQNAADFLRKSITDELVDAGLTYKSAAGFSTPRRLSLVVEDLLAQSPEKREERKGPKVGAPQAAVDGFCRGAGITPDALEIRDTGKGEVYFAVLHIKSRPASEIVAEALEKTIRRFAWPKSMRWGSGSLRWVRPLHNILCILCDEEGSQIVPLEVDHLRSNDLTFGHRFMAPEAIKVTGFDQYCAALKRAHVLIDRQERAALIQNDAQNLAFAQGLELVEDEGLLAEIVGLVEWPEVIMGSIDKSFHALPAEVLQTSMREHQKFFSLRDPKSKQITHFITVANNASTDDHATVLTGNQKVLFARLSDALFFWQNDLREAKAGMHTWRAALEHVTFHNKLGSVADLIARLEGLSQTLVPIVGADAQKAQEAAGIAKVDLQSQMVFEFPELQGIMGRYYAQHAGRSDDIAAACAEHYAPLGPSDTVPTAPISVTLALAEKIDKLAGFWAINEKPTGSKDPFALRRAALGVIRLVLENDLSINLREVFAKTEHACDGDDLVAFFHDRLKVFLRDQGLRHDVIDACIAMPAADDLRLLVKRARALSQVLTSSDGENLVQGFKRAHNILNQAQERDGVSYSFGADEKYAQSDAERAIFTALKTNQDPITKALKAEDFDTAMQSLAALRGPLDAFFDEVQINAESEILRRNRLNLLNSFCELCLKVADLDRLEG